jgi:hypothetical protein
VARTTDRAGHFVRRELDRQCQEAGWQSEEPSERSEG